MADVTPGEDAASIHYFKLNPRWVRQPKPPPPDRPVQIPRTIYLRA